MKVLKLLPLLDWVLLPGFTSALTGPPTVAGFLGRSLSVVCPYAKGYQTYVKYWCRGANWDYCSTVVATKGTEEEVKAGRTLIKDNHARREFTVTLEILTQQDAGFYWCAIGRRGIDLGFLINIIVNPDSEEKLPPSPPPTDYPSYVPFPILIGLKMILLICLVFAIIWMHRWSGWASDKVILETPPQELELHGEVQHIYHTSVVTSQSRELHGGICMRGKPTRRCNEPTQARQAALPPAQSWLELGMADKSATKPNEFSFQ
ncbi:CMRF35-like molecule 5 [Elgaria multicarinata webbii]|uniref:CMRF35-like molecule 5 n=1 Tax=Elgaria multicarinata webbii TaxID=159646 RepID=UPI002FCD108A